MNPEQLKELEDSLWQAADQLRANSKLNATEYSMPVLGLIFLRHATNRFDRVHAQIETTLPTRSGRVRALTADDFASAGAIFLPEEARYDTIAALPESEDLGKAIKEAMEAIEAQVPELLQGVLPKEYGNFEPDLLRELVRIFNGDELRLSPTDDVFGRIYEYFLNKFAQSGAQEGGEFFTPPSLVRTIVNFIEPTGGLIMDPAVGSAGMFVQAAHAIEAQGRSAAEVATFVGQEKSETNTRLALMNLAVHGLEGTIRQGNTFYDRISEHVGQADYVMANPPFNVDMVDPHKLEGDPRLLVPIGEHGVSAKTKTISNANYLWIQYFYSYLKPTGRAGFVMAQSATDAGSWEQKIRKQIVDTGDVDIMVSIGTNFFYTVTLPCSLWFFDRNKPAERKNQTLMLDTREIYRVVSRKVRDFSDEQLQNLSAIVWLYRGETDRYTERIGQYLQDASNAAKGLHESLESFEKPTKALLEQLNTLVQSAPKDVDASSWQNFENSRTQLRDAVRDMQTTKSRLVKTIAQWHATTDGAPALTNAEQVKRHDSFLPITEQLQTFRKQLNDVHKSLVRCFDIGAKELKLKNWSAWNGRDYAKESKALDQGRDISLEAIKAVTYPFAQVTWLQSRFPDGVFVDVPGLCKVVSTEEIAGQDYSLTPGRYVGVAPPEPEDEEAVEARLREIHTELAGLNEEAAELAQIIAKNVEELLG